MASCYYFFIGIIPLVMGMMPFVLAEKLFSNRIIYLKFLGISMAVFFMIALYICHKNYEIIDHYQEKIERTAYNIGSMNWISKYVLIKTSWMLFRIVAYKILKNLWKGLNFLLKKTFITLKKIFNR
jgi:hypothetical protein